MRRTKIIATLGPAANDYNHLLQLLAAGVDLVRLNFSHGTLADHKHRVELVRQCSAALGKEIGILADLQGPKIRIARFKQGAITLTAGDTFILDAALGENEGDHAQVGIDYKALPQDVCTGDDLLLDDGLIELRVNQVRNQQITCQVLAGGKLSNNKGINRRGGGLSAKALTDKDKEDLRIAVALDVDYIAISFPRNADDMYHAKRLIAAEGSNTGIIAKIERTEAVKNIDEIIHASDAVMVARGDLGVELGYAELPGVQKRIIQRARALNKAVITATQMMESMIHNPIPTRAEVFDVANAVLDGTDAVMLSAETATGAHPHKVVAAMAEICASAEKERLAQVSGHRMECKFNRADEAIAMSAMYAANHMQIKAIIALTESGSTPLWMSRIRSGIPIYALTRHLKTQRRVTLYRGVYAIAFDATGESRDTLNQAAIDTLKRHGDIQKGDLVILTKGDFAGQHGGTNAMKIIVVD
jgi:pyruvate kinase